MAKNIEQKVCTFECPHAEFAKDAYCSDNIGMYCKRYKQIVLKYSPCLDDSNKNKSYQKR